MTGEHARIRIKTCCEGSLRGYIPSVLFLPLSDTWRQSVPFCVVRLTTTLDDSLISPRLVNVVCRVHTAISAACFYVWLMQRAISKPIWVCINTSQYELMRCAISKTLRFCIHTSQYYWQLTGGRSLTTNQHCTTLMYYISYIRN